MIEWQTVAHRPGTRTRSGAPELGLRSARFHQIGQVVSAETKEMVRLTLRVLTNEKPNELGGRQTPAPDRCWSRSTRR